MEEIIVKRLEGYLQYMETDVIFPDVQDKRSFLEASHEVNTGKSVELHVHPTFGVNPYGMGRVL